MNLYLSKIHHDQRKLFNLLNLKEFKESTSHSQSKDIDIKKKKGIFYTPKEITSYICFQTLVYSILQTLNKDGSELFELFEKGSSEELQKLLSYVGTIKILDPACGAGIFLVVFAEMLFQIKKILLNKLKDPISEYELKRRIILNNIYGVDLFKDAVETTKTSLIKWLSSNLQQSQVDLPSLEQNIRLGNSLVGWLDEDLGDIDIHDHQLVNQQYLKSINEKFVANDEDSFQKKLQNSNPMHWRIDFNSILSSGGFDIIIGNPPYVFIRGKNFSPFEIQVYKEKYLKDFDSLAKGKARQSRKINTFALFLMRCVNLLKPGGYLGFIVPNTLLRTTTNDRIRQFILENTYIQEIVDLKGDIFKGVTASTILLFLQKTINKQDRSTLINYNISDLLNFQFDSHLINQTRFYTNPVLAFNIHLDSEMEEIFTLMKENTFELSAVSKEIIEGIVCRKKDNLFTDNATHPLAKKLLRGKDIGRYQINWKQDQYIIYARDTSITETKLHRPRPQWVHEAPEKLLTQRIGGGIFPIQVAYDDSQYYTFASINNILLKNPLIYDNSEYLSKYILGLLNSKLINAYYFLNYSNKSSLTVNISKTFLESLPIKKADISTQRLVSIIVDYLLFLYQYHKTDTQILEFFDSYLLDPFIYEIYLPTQLETNFIDLLPDYLAELPPTASKEEQFQFISMIMQQLQTNSALTQTINKLKSNRICQRIENLFEKRVTLHRK